MACNHKQTEKHLKYYRMRDEIEKHRYSNKCPFVECILLLTYVPMLRLGNVN